jgi:hypothetical protein
MADISTDIRNNAEKPFVKRRGRKKRIKFVFSSRLVIVVGSIFEYARRTQGVQNENES